MICGIDPGLSGAWAIVSPKGDLVDCGDMPIVGVKAQNRVNAAELAAILKEQGVEQAVLEIVGAMPGQGVSSMFRFGRACGAIDGVLGALNIPVHYVAPVTWKKHFRISGKGSDGAEQARQRAIELWPVSQALFAQKKDHNRADAALIARWYVQGR